MAKKKANDRVPIPDELATKVLFASDRTCCVCRMEKHKIQIHHIDGDPSNNTFDNLAVICLYCHSDAHTTGAFVRNLTPELIQLYNSSWRDIVRLRLEPPTEGAGKLELASEAFLEASLDCHRWKLRFMSLAGTNLPDGKPGEFVDVWDLMAERWIPKYSEDVYRRFLELFTDGRLEDHPAERDVIDLVGQLKGEGMAVRTIAAELNRRGIPARGSRWHHTTIQRLLTAA